ncbi:hypothetical protein SAMN04487975_1092 [Planococcus glaciei]|uniref:DUF7685 domain-containing protein n=1 Tax=Planococcus glaciei TaxID=459472 RepID=UPI000882B123|nr:hypothetical protein [Planococcus glaciei]SDH86853.1 hypothetical protein SAMN04487975_1092 [Planococcus glaciei]
MAECQLCGRDNAYTHFDEERICLACYNGKMAKELGVEAESYWEGVAIRDGKGTVNKSRPCVKHNSRYTNLA